jgi:non-specific serine/threonine protein kinase
LATLALHQGDLERAAARYAEALVVAHALGEVKLGDARGIGMATALRGLGRIADARGEWAQAAVRFEEALALGRSQGNRDFMASCMGSLAQVALHQGDLEKAVGLQREALRLYRAAGNQVFVANTLEELAMLAAAAGQSERAARLLGVEAALREAMGLPILSEEQANIETSVAPTRVALGEEDWAAAFSAGQTLTLEEAIAEALGETTRR